MSPGREEYKDKCQLNLCVSLQTELIHAAGSTTVPQVLLQGNCSCDWLSTGHVLSFIHNKKRRANRKKNSQTAKIEKYQLCRLQR